ncbi:MAG: hypothetical protein J3K34DRAFT_414749 [Monoraphidium minutum]|nr:MAG: hypothetical protein J3K34DRAFT_414749 [Monoraphidium minutum]
MGAEATRPPGRQLEFQVTPRPPCSTTGKKLPPATANSKMCRHWNHTQALHHKPVRGGPAHTPPSLRPRFRPRSRPNLAAAQLLSSLPWRPLCAPLCAPLGPAPSAQDPRPVCGRAPAYPPCADSAAAGPAPLRDAHARFAPLLPPLRRPTARPQHSCRLAAARAWAPDPGGLRGRLRFRLTP